MDELQRRYDQRYIKHIMLFLRTTAGTTLQQIYKFRLTGEEHCAKQLHYDGILHLEQALLLLCTSEIL